MMLKVWWNCFPMLRVTQKRKTSDAVEKNIDVYRREKLDLYGSFRDRLSLLCLGFKGRQQKSKICFKMTAFYLFCWWYFFIDQLSWYLLLTQVFVLSSFCCLRQRELSHSTRCKWKPKNHGIKKNYFENKTRLQLNS